MLTENNTQKKLMETEVGLLFMGGCCYAFLSLFWKQREHKYIELMK